MLSDCKLFCSLCDAALISIISNPAQRADVSRFCHCLAVGKFSNVQVMTVVKGLAKTGTTICATIHSPTSYCFGLFDRIMMLLQGHLIYAGPNGA